MELEEAEIRKAIELALEPMGSGAEAMRRILLSINNDYCKFSAYELRRLDAQNKAIAFKLLTHYAAHRETYNLIREIGGRDVFKRLWDIENPAEVEDN